MTSVSRPAFTSDCERVERSVHQESDHQVDGLENVYHLLSLVADVEIHNPDENADKQINNQPRHHIAFITFIEKHVASR